MPTADSLAAMLKNKSTLIPPKAPVVVPKVVAKPVVDPSAARYAAMEAQAKAQAAAAAAAKDDQIGRRIAISAPITTSTVPKPTQTTSMAPYITSNNPSKIEDQLGRRIAIGEPITTSTAIDKYGKPSGIEDQIGRRVALGEPITTSTAVDKYGKITNNVTTTTTTTNNNNGSNNGSNGSGSFTPPNTIVVEQPPTEVVTPLPILLIDPPSGNGSGGSDSSGSNSSVTPAIKVATPDIITIDQETLPAELMAALIFESIGGQELLSLSRHDLITGGNLEYQPIRNMSIINAEYNSSNIIFMPDSATAYLRNFPIRWDSHIIESFSDLDSSHIKIDATKNELVIIVTDMKPGEQVEVETLKSVTSYDYTKF